MVPNQTYLKSDKHGDNNQNTMRFRLNVFIDLAHNHCETDE